MIASCVQKRLREKRGSSEKREILSGFFKCGLGEYGEGDRFLGVPVPEQRKIAKLFFGEATLADTEMLLASAYHEDRLTGLLLLVYRFERSEKSERENIFRFYIEHTERINNWDLVDVTCPHIVGMFLVEHPQKRKVLFQWSVSKNVWERRMAIVATFACIRAGELQPTFDIAIRFLGDKHDLIHKATGWMLREAGKRNAGALKNFLRAHATRMPRTMLRYAIERFPKEEREKILRYSR